MDDASGFSGWYHAQHDCLFILTFEAFCNDMRSSRNPLLGPMVRYAMTTGIVKGFDPIRGIGFIAPGDGSIDAPVPIWAVEQAGEVTLRQGQKIEYDEAANCRRKT